jgi:hypothetical protein
VLRLKPTPEYESAKAALSRTAQRALAIVEDGIRSDPHFRVRQDMVELLDVIDLKKARRWR